MDAPWVVRNANPADVAAVWAIETASFSDPWPQDAFLDPIYRPFLVAEILGQVVGFLLGRIAADEGEILDVAVVSQFRNRGMGKGLVEAAQTVFVQAGVSQVFLEVRVSNSQARSTYTACGFQLETLRRNYYQNPREDAAVLKWVSEGKNASQNRG